MITPTYPNTKTEAADILNAVRAGCGNHFPAHLINYCLLLTGDL